MMDKKPGLEVLVRGKIKEIILSERGIAYRIIFNEDNATASFLNEIIVNEAQIVG